MGRILKLAKIKLSVLFGGRLLLLPAALLALALMFFTIASVLTAQRRGAAALTVIDRTGSALSAALISSIEETDGIAIRLADSMEAAERDVTSGRAEGIFEILPGYDDGLLEDSISGLISLRMAPGSVSADFIRETVSGKLLAQRAYVRAESELVSEGFDSDELKEKYSEFSAPTLYTVTSIAGGETQSRAVFGKSFPGYEGFAALALMLLMLSLTRQLSEASSRLVSVRMRVPKAGTAAGFFSDLLSVFAVAAAISALAFAFAPEKTLSLAVSLAAYSFELTGLCLLLSRVVGAGRIDVASPFIALVTSILGGCFADYSSGSKALRVISLITPQGKLISAVSGRYVFALILLAEGIILAAAAFTIDKRRA
jgi:hypothetical protein